jgi:hypothetical protein
MFIIQIHAYPRYGYCTAIRTSLHEAIALREDLAKLGYLGLTITEVCKDGSVRYHLPGIEHGDPMGLYKELLGVEYPGAVS